MVADLENQGLLAKIDDHQNAVGECYRCQTVIEPYLSLQWYVKVKPLAEQAIKAVQDGRTRIVPAQWEKTYFEWMFNIQDWCISRQIWWGHRIPAWYCEDCGGITVSREDADRLRRLRQRGAPPGQRRPRHLVLLGPVAVLNHGLAGADGDAGEVLPDQLPRHRLRHPLLLGGADDDDGAEVHGRRSPSPTSTSMPWCATPRGRR